MLDTKIVDAVINTAKRAEDAVEAALKVTHLQEITDNPLVKTFVPQLSEVYKIGTSGLAMIEHLTDSAKTGAVVLTATQKADVDALGDSLRAKAIELNERVQALT